MTILHFTKDMVRRIVDEFPRCIECGDDHLAATITLQAILPHTFTRIFVCAAQGLRQTSW